tara:strand:+ start:1745 stop:2179 length:435 start_codon:yes stop_codon:yes gene_type:complete
MGRKSLLTPDRIKKICDAISVGATYEIAAGYAGIHVRTLYGWMAKGEKGEDDYLQFFQALKTSEAKGAIQNLTTIMGAAREGHWQAAAWILERRHSYVRQPDTMPIAIQIDAEQISVSALVDELYRPVDALKAIGGPVIDLEED